MHGAFVCGLRGGEAGLVHAVVDVVVCPVVGCFDLRLQVGGEEVDVFVILGQDRIEFGVEHADDFGGFVGDDGVSLFVPEGWHSETAFVGGVHGKVEVAQVGVFGMERVGVCEVAGDVGLFVFGDETPACNGVSMNNRGEMRVWHLSGASRSGRRSLG